MNLAKILTDKKEYLADVKNVITRVAAVIPAYNVQNTVRKVVIQAKELVDDIFVVDDGSKDNTHQLLQNLDVRIINHKKNQGLGSALRSGFDIVMRENFDIVVTLDSDGQHDAFDIKRLVDKLIIDDVDAVIGSRLLEKSQWKYFPKHRLLGNIVLTFLTNLAAGRKVTTDSQSGFRAIRIESLKKLNLTTKKMAISSEIVFELVRNDLKISDVSTKATYDKEISNVKAVSDISGILWLLLKKRFNFKKKNSKGARNR